MKNLPFKIMALLMAVLVWYFARQGGESIQSNFFTPLIFRNLPSSLMVTAGTSQVNISAKTTSRRGQVLNPAEVQAVLDLKNAKEGRYDYILTKEDILTPEGVEITRITPSQITLTIDQVMEKTLPIEARYRGVLAEGYLLDKITIIPPSIKVRGPSSTLKTLESVRTSEIDLKGLNSSIDMLVQLDFNQENVQVLANNVDFYSAHITVESMPIRRRFDEVKIYLQNTTFVSRINPQVFNVFLEGTPEILNELDVSQLYGVVDIDNRVPGNYRIKPKFTAPKGITLLEQWPTVSLWVKNIPILEEASTLKISDNSSTETSTDNKTLSSVVLEDATPPTSNTIESDNSSDTLSLPQKAQEFLESLTQDNGTGK